MLFGSVVRLVFKVAEPGTVSLANGNANASGPQYDLSLVASRLLTVPRQVARLVATPAGTRDRRGLEGMEGGVILWTALGLVVVILLVVVCLVPMLAFSLGRQYLVYQETLGATAERTMRAAKRTAAGVDQMLQARIAVLETLALSPALRERNIEPLHAHLRRDQRVFRRWPAPKLVRWSTSGIATFSDQTAICTK